MPCLMNPMAIRLKTPRKTTMTNIKNLLFFTRKYIDSNSWLDVPTIVRLVFRGTMPKPPFSTYGHGYDPKFSEPKGRPPGTISIRVHGLVEGFEFLFSGMSFLRGKLREDSMDFQSTCPPWFTYLHDT